MCETERRDLGGCEHAGEAERWPSSFQPWGAGGGAALHTRGQRLCLPTAGAPRDTGFPAPCGSEASAHCPAPCLHRSALTGAACAAHSARRVPAPSPGGRPLRVPRRPHAGPAEDQAPDGHYHRLVSKKSPLLCFPPLRTALRFSSSLYKSLYSPQAPGRCLRLSHLGAPPGRRLLRR